MADILRLPVGLKFFITAILRQQKIINTLVEINKLFKPCSKKQFISSSDKQIFSFFTFGYQKYVAMNKTVKLKEQLKETRVQFRKSKDPNLKGRKYKGGPYLKLKKVKTDPRFKIRQLLRGFVPLDELRQSIKPEQSIQ